MMVIIYSFFLTIQQDGSDDLQIFTLELISAYQSNT